MRAFVGLFVCAGLAVAADKAPAPIRFEDATAKAGIQFTHSFGAERLGSLLEATGAGCVWFDYNNDGLPDLYVVSGRPLGPGMHPHPLRKPPAEMPHNHLYRNNGNGTFTDVTDKAGLGDDAFSFAAIAADYDNDGYTDLLVTSYGKVTLYRNNGNGTFEDVTEKAGLKFDGWAIGAGVARLRPRWLRRPLHRPVCEVRSHLSLLLRSPIIIPARSITRPTATCCFTTTATALSRT